jgi:uncharacterized damage-inducible protein DinB
MVAMLRELLAHQAWADATILAAVRSHMPASEDAELRKTLHHIIGVQRAFLAVFLQRPFHLAREMQAPANLDEMETLFRQTHAEEIAFAGQVQEAAIAQVVEIPMLAKIRPTLGETMMQVVMHSQHHRGQVAARLRALGATPPTVDWIIWLKERPGAWD